MFKRLFLLLSVCYLLTAPIVAQVNIEVFLNKKALKKQSLDFSYTAQQGVAGVENYRLNYNLDTQDPQWRWLIISDFSRLSNPNERNFHDGLVHLRSMYRLNPVLEWEQFIQQQWSDVQQLSRRFLVATGLR